MLIGWNQAAGHSDDYKRIEEIKSRIKQLESENFTETVEGTGIDLDSVNVNEARYRISLNAELFELYRKSKKVVFSMTPLDGAIKRKDVIIEMMLSLKNEDDPKSQELLGRLIGILKESHL